METSFVTVIGYVLGVLIVFILAGVCLKPIKFIMKLCINSALGGAALVIINLLGGFAGIHIGINPVTAIAVGVLGVPAVAVMLLLQIFY
ncbi:MAG: pro-sigmaK processing inhibitor BofA family protein [Clostridia bacterium]|nr:pro-sigmaK processing inhibitor BofA family protein [Clostridia bacterium]